MQTQKGWLRTHAGRASLALLLVVASALVVVVTGTWPGIVRTAAVLVFWLIALAPILIMAYILRLVVIALRKYINS